MKLRQKGFDRERPACKPRWRLYKESIERRDGLGQRMPGRQERRPNDISFERPCRFEQIENALCSGKRLVALGTVARLRGGQRQADVQLRVIGIKVQSPLKCHERLV